MLRMERISYFILVFVNIQSICVVNSLYFPRTYANAKQYDLKTSTDSNINVALYLVREQSASRITITTLALAKTETKNDFDSRIANPSLIPGDIEKIRNDVALYMKARQEANATVLPPEFIEYVPGASTKKSKQNNPFEFIQPSGWYKDKVMLDIESRSDKTAPLYAHPLSSSELSKYGYESLSSIVLANGGPYAVGNMLNIIWREPIRKKRIIKTNSKPQQQPGQLSLGSAFSNILDESASLLNLEEIKASLQTNNDADEEEWEEVDEFGNTLPKQMYQQLGVDYADGMDYVEFYNSGGGGVSQRRFKSDSTYDSNNKKAISIEKDLVMYSEEKFRLKGSERLYTIFLCLIGTLGYGRATGDLITELQDMSNGKISNNLVMKTITNFINSNNVMEIVTGLQFAFPLIVCLSIVCSVKSGQFAHTNNRNVPIWILKTFLGGPQVLLKLLTLPPIPINNNSEKSS